MLHLDTGFEGKQEKYCLKPCDLFFVHSEMKLQNRLKGSSMTQQNNSVEDILGLLNVN